VRSRTCTGLLSRAGDCLLVASGRITKVELQLLTAEPIFMTNRKAPGRSEGVILEVVPVGECGSRELAKILCLSARAPKQWRDLGRGPPYREDNGRIIYDARSVVDWLQRDSHGREILSSFLRQR
jgi:hypothetical protein